MIYYIVGLAGSGKTTHASHLVYKAHKKGLNVYCNVPIFNAYVFDPLEDLMTYSVKDGLVIIDEAAIDFNSRRYKTMSDNVNEFVRKHRHAHTNIYVYSQNFMGADKLFRDNAEYVILLRRSRVPHHAFVRIYKHDILPPDKDNPEFRDIYRLDILSTRLMRYGGKYVKTFNSFEMPPLPDKEWIMWQDTNMFSPTPKRCNRFLERWTFKKKDAHRYADKRQSKAQRSLLGSLSGSLFARLTAAAARFVTLFRLLRYDGEKNENEKQNTLTLSDETENNTNINKQETEINQTKENTSQYILQKGASSSPSVI